MQMNPYLSFNGQCEAAFKFYEQCLGGQLGAIGLANSSHGYRQRNDAPGCAQHYRFRDEKGNHWPIRKNATGSPLALSTRSPWPIPIVNRATLATNPLEFGPLCYPSAGN